MCARFLESVQTGRECELYDPIISMASRVNTEPELGIEMGAESPMDLCRNLREAVLVLVHFLACSSFAVVCESSAPVFSQIGGTFTFSPPLGNMGCKSAG